MEAKTMCEKGIPHHDGIVQCTKDDDAVCPYEHMRQALLRYARHDDGEGGTKPCRSLEDGPDTCDCGLDALLRKVNAI